MCIVYLLRSFLLCYSFFLIEHLNKAESNTTFLIKVLKVGESNRDFYVIFNESFFCSYIISLVIEMHCNISS